MPLQGHFDMVGFTGKKPRGHEALLYLQPRNVPMPWKLPTVSMAGSSKKSPQLLNAVLLKAFSQWDNRNCGGDPY